MQDSFRGIYRLEQRGSFPPFLPLLCSYLLSYSFYLSVSKLTEKEKGYGIDSIVICTFVFSDSNRLLSA